MQLCISAFIICFIFFFKIVTESFAITDVTAATRAVLFRSESKGSGFHGNERPQHMTLRMKWFLERIQI